MPNIMQVHPTHSINDVRDKLQALHEGLEIRIYRTRVSEAFGVYKHDVYGILESSDELFLTKHAKRHLAIEFKSEI